MLGIVEEQSKMLQRKPLQKVSHNSAPVTRSRAVRKPYATQKKGTARVPKRAEHISEADEIVNPPAPTLPPDLMLTKRLFSPGAPNSALLADRRSE